MVHLKDFSLVCPGIQNNDVLKAIEMAIPAEAIEQALANTQSEEERKRSLPAHLVVSLVIAMSLWSKDSMRDVLKNLIDGLSEAWVKVGKYWRVPMFVSHHTSEAAIRCKGDEPIISAVGATNGDRTDIRSVSKWSPSSGH